MYTSTTDGYRIIMRCVTHKRKYKLADDLGHPPSGGGPIRRDRSGNRFVRWFPTTNDAIRFVALATGRLPQHE